MKAKIFILSSLLCLYGLQKTYASDCVGTECDFNTTEIGMDTEWTDAEWTESDTGFYPQDMMSQDYIVNDMTEFVTGEYDMSIDTTTADYWCPFDTTEECEIWRKKPIFRETVSPRSARLNDASVSEFLYAADYNENFNANMPEAAPLLERYKMLMRSAQACCTDGMTYALKQAGASDGLVYKFLSDDANFYEFGARCLMMSDHDLDAMYPNTATSVVVADVRNGCLCRGRQWFRAMLAPFQQVYQAHPEFKNTKFNYTYIDGLRRKITVSVNNDVQNVLKQLALCP